MNSTFVNRLELKVTTEHPANWERLLRRIIREGRKEVIYYEISS